jgi:hypothetical protein
LYSEQTRRALTLGPGLMALRRAGLRARPGPAHKFSLLAHILLVMCTTSGSRDPLGHRTR